MKNVQIVIFILLILAILFLAHLVVYFGVAAIFDVNSVWLKIGFIFLWLSFICSQILAGRYNNIFTRFFYRTAAIWTGFMFYLFLATCVYGIVAAIAPSATHINTVGVGLFVLATLVSFYGLMHASDITVENVSVRLLNLPQVWKGRRIVWISDVHLGQIRGINFLRRIVSRINLIDAHILFIGGDLYDGVACDEQKIILPLADLKLKIGAYFITGNHDGFSDQATSRDVNAVASIGVVVLRDKLIEIEGLQILGVDYSTTVNSDQYEEILSGLNIDLSKPSIMLKHVPSNVDIAERAGVSLQLSGHTHRAQVQPLSFIPGIVYKGFAYGLNKLGQMQVFTSSGVGTWGPPFRVGTNSEIVVITLE